MNNTLYNEINKMDISSEIKDSLLSLAKDNVYIEYIHLYEIINGLEVNVQNNIMFLVYEYNKKIFMKEKQIQKELKAIQNIKNNATTNNFENKEDDQTINNKPIKSYNSELDLDISSYMKIIRSVNNVEDLENILPDYYTDKYEHLIQKILLDLQKDAKDFYDLYVSSIDEDEKQEYMKELKEVKEKINYIIDYHQEQLLQQDNLETEEHESNNKIIYLKTESGTPYSLKDLKNIDPTYYESFLELFNSIENGSFKNFKSFNGSNSNIGNIYEVRGFKTRIIFDRVSNDTYIVLLMLVKKINNDTYYQTALSDRVNTYRKQKNDILKSINNEDYLNECNEITNEIKETLSSKARKGYM